MSQPQSVGPEGRYRLGRPLGQGGMGLLFEAEDQVLRRRIAVKLLRPEWLVDQAALARFRREAQLLSRLTHPNVARLYEVELDQTPAYLVMELLDGEDLQHRLDAGERLAGPEARRMAVELAEALAALHAGGVVHRDVKPANVFCERSGRVRLLDLGLALPLDATRITREGNMVGTLAFLSPEMALGTLPTPASDVYQVALVLHVGMTGRLPFEGADAPQRLFQDLLCGKPLTVRLAPALPADLAAVLEPCLAQDPTRRPPDGRALAASLAATAAQVRPTVAAPPSAPTAEAEDRPRRPGRAAWVAGGLMAAALLACVLGARRGGSGNAPASMAERPAPRLLDVEHGGPNLRVRWRADHGAPALLVARAQGAQVATAPATMAPDGSWSAALEGLPLLSDELLVEPGPGSAPWPPVALHRALRTEVRALARSLAPFDLGQVLAGLGKPSLDELRVARLPAPLAHQELARSRRARRDEVAEELALRLSVLPCLEDYRRAAALSPLAFRARLVPFDDLATFQEALAGPWSLYLFALFERYPVAALEPPPRFGRLATVREPLPGSVPETTVLTPTASSPVTLSRGLRTVFGGRLEWTSPFPVRAPAEAAAYELELRFRTWGRLALRVEVNGTFCANAYPLPPVADDEPEHRRVAYQRLDPSVLRPGLNRLTLRVEPFDGRTSSDEVALTGVALRVLPRPSTDGGPVLSDPGIAREGGSLR